MERKDEQLINLLLSIVDARPSAKPGSMEFSALEVIAEKLNRLLSMGQPAMNSPEPSDVSSIEHSNTEPINISNECGLPFPYIQYHAN